jgi:hypothetical protein
MFQLSSNNGVASFNFRDNNDAWILASGGSVADGKIHHLVGVRDTSARKARLFIDGSLVTETSDTTTVAITASTTQNWIGRRYPCGDSELFSGTIDEVAVYRSALSASRIEDHYALGVNGAPATSEANAPADTFTYDPNSDNGFSFDPVQTHSGSYIYSRTDVRIAGRGPSPSIIRDYHTSDTRTTVVGPGWTFNYNAHVGDPGDGSGALILVSPDGGSNRFTPAGGNAYTAPSGINTALALNPGGGYIATLADLTTWTFDQAGRLSAVTDR